MRKREWLLIGTLIIVLFVLESIAVHALYASRFPGTNDYYPRWAGARALLLEGRDPEQLFGLPGDQVGFCPLGVGVDVGARLVDRLGARGPQDERGSDENGDDTTEHDLASTAVDWEPHVITKPRSVNSCLLLHPL